MRSVLVRSLAVLLVGGAVLAAILYVASTVDSRPPVVTGIELTQHLGSDDAVALTTTSVEVAFSEVVDHRSAESAFRIEPPLDGSFSWSGATLTFTPTDPLPLDAEFEVSLAAGVRDAAGNEMQAATDPFAFSTVGSPRVASTVPAAGEADVPLGTSVEVVFSTLMDTSSVESALSIAPAVPHELRWSGESLTITPDEPLGADTTYRVEIGTSATDLAGTALEEPLALTFTTARTGLDVAHVVPASGIEGIAPTTPIAVIFDRPLDPGSADAALLTISPDVAGSLEVTALPGAAGLDADGARLLRFTPSGPLPANTTFDVALAPGIRSADGGELTEPVEWTFTTGAASTTLSNQIVFLTDRGGVTNVWAMNPDGTNQRQVSAELSPVTDVAVAPDGRSLVTGDGVRLVEQLVDGRDRRILTDAAHLEFDPAYTPDGRIIAFGRADAATGGGLGIWQRGTAGGDAARLTPGDGDDDPSPSPSPSGDGSPGPLPLLREPAYSPDGEALAYVDTAGRVIVVELDDDRLSGVPLRAAGPPAWMPDSTALLVVGARLEERLDADDVPLHPAMTPVDPLDPAAATDRDELEVLRLPRGAGAVRGTALAEGAVRLAIDGSGRIAFVELEADEAMGSIWITSAGGGAQAPVTGNGTLRATWVAFTPERGTLVASGASVDGAPLGISLIDLDGGASERLTVDGTRPRWLP